MGITSLLSSLFSAVSSVFGFLRDRSNLKNAPDIKASVEAQNIAKQNDTINTAVKERDADEIRKQLAE